MASPAKILVFGNKPAISTVALPQTAAVEGIVRQVLGRSLIGATVRLWDASWKLVGALQTDVAGTFRFEGVRAGHYVASVDVPPGFTLKSTEASFNLNEGGRLKLEFNLVPIGTVAGRVVDKSLGTPIAGAHVEVLDSKGRKVAGARTSKSGDYAFEGIVGDTMRVQLVD